MTIQKARKVLGKRAEKMTDDEISKIILFLEKLVNRVIDNVVSPDYAKKNKKGFPVRMINQTLRIAGDYHFFLSANTLTRSRAFG